MAETSLTLPRQRTFKDISLTFAQNPVTHDIVTVTQEEAVKRAIKNILMTQTGEIPFFPEFGSRISALLFEPMDPITTALLESEIYASLRAFEPRCRIISVVIQPDEDNNLFHVSMTIALLNQVQPVTLTLFLSRLR